MLGMGVFPLDQIADVGVNVDVEQVPQAIQP